MTTLEDMSIEDLRAEVERLRDMVRCVCELERCRTIRVDMAANADHTGFILTGTYPQDPEKEEKYIRIIGGMLAGAFKQLAEETPKEADDA